VPLWLGNGECSTDLPGEPVGNLHVPRYGFHVTRGWIAPEFVLLALPLEKTAVTTEMPEQRLLLH
jgi:hypothetical protein